MVSTPGKDGASTSGSIESSVAPKKYIDHGQLHQGQLYDHSEVNRIVVERSMEWNGRYNFLDFKIDYILSVILFYVIKCVV